MSVIAIYHQSPMSVRHNMLEMKLRKPPEVGDKRPESVSVKNFALPCLEMHHQALVKSTA
jgi:hypothetical protein